MSHTSTRCDSQSIVDDEERSPRLVELNVIEQVANVCRATILHRAWYRGQRIRMHGLVYGLSDGRLHRVGVSVSGEQPWDERYRESLKNLKKLNLYKE